MNKKFLLAFCCLYFTSIYTPSRLTAYSVGGNELTGVFEEPLTLPDGEHFTGRQLREANPGANLNEFFKKIIREFGFNYDHPSCIKFVPRSDGKFTCVNMTCWNVRVEERDGTKIIVLEIEEVVTFNKYGYRDDVYNSLRREMMYSAFLPLVCFVGEDQLQANKKPGKEWETAMNGIMKGIGRGCTLQDYDALIQKHVPLKATYFLESMSVNHCVPTSLFDDYEPRFFDSIEDAAAGLLAAIESPEV